MLSDEIDATRSDHLTGLAGSRSHGKRWSQICEIAERDHRPSDAAQARECPNFCVRGAETFLQRRWVVGWTRSDAV